MMRKFYDDDFNFIGDDQANEIANGLMEFQKQYLRFLIPNIKDTKLKRYLKKLKKMIKKIKDKDRRHEVFNMKMVRLIKEDGNGDSRLYD